MEIILQNLTKSFPSRDKKDRREVVAVDHFSFTVPDGQLIGLLGPSGCGKSTTLHLISGLQTPTEGRIFFGKDDVTDLPPEQRGIGLVFQNYALYPHLTVKQNILFPLQNLKGKEKLSKQQMLAKAYEAAKLVQIVDLMERKPSELSGGQQQRVAIARALVKMPRVLLLDEPLSNLDARLRLQTREEIRRIQRETGITTIFVTHDQEEAMSISDWIVVMKEGVVQQIGRPQEVYDDPDNLFVAKFLGTPPINVFEGEVRNRTLYIGEEPVLTEQELFEADRASTRKTPEEGSRPEVGSTPEDGSTPEKGSTLEEALPTARRKSLPDGKVYVGIRPEGFCPNEKGALGCRFQRVEVMGRDISVVSEHAACVNPSVRSIIHAENQVVPQNGTVRFDLLPHKVFLFDRETERRLL